MAESIIQIKSLPGIKRDGTVFEGDNYVDGQWMRFQRGLPRKMGGYRSINRFLQGIARTINAYTKNQLTYVHAASANKIERLYIDNNYNTSLIFDRTPSTLDQNDANLWQFDIETQTNPTTGVFTNLLMAQVAPNLNCICNNTGGQLFYGNLFDTSTLTELTEAGGNLPPGYSVTGGVVALHPYTFIFGNDGYIAWSIPGDPTDYVGAGSGSANVAAQKIVRGISMRGGPGNSPSGLFWSADALIRASFVGGDAVFQFDTISTQTSIMSAASVIEYDGIFYWVGTDRFLMFNGVVREVENNLNTNFFFDNLNYSQRQKVYATKVPRFGEIWFCFPKGNSNEPNHAVVYNVRENTWYDTALPNGGRGAAVFPSVFRKPIMTGVEPNADDKYKMWIHEIGTDEIDGQSIQPIQSYFETCDFSMPVKSQINKAIQVLMVEPDFVQSGDLTMQVIGRANARSPTVYSETKTIVQTPQIPQQQVIYFKDQRRELRFRFESNVIGGDYQMGQVLAHIQPGDGTVIG